MKKSIIAAVFASSAALSAVPTTAFSGSELLLREHTPFHVCRDTVHRVLARLGARSEQLRLEMDTGAHYRVRLVAVEAELAFRCNKVSETLEISRDTVDSIDLLAKGN